MIYTVKSGDTISSIARKLGTTPAQIINDNGISSPDALAVGEDLVILYPAVTYTVKQGDTLDSIAEAYGISINDIYKNNPSLDGKSMVTPGETLVISFQSPYQLGSIELNGYAYPYINDEVLRKTLPYLTYLSVFTYGINNDGSLIFPEGEERLISTAKEYGTVPLMMLTSLGADGNFSNELVATVLSDTDMSDKVIENAISEMNNKGYGGIDVDFEYISPEFAGSYVSFLELMRSRMPEDKVLFASLAPKNSSVMRGLLYEGHDYGAVGNAADNVLLMTYEWGYTYGPPMAVSPINKVREVIDYGVSQIPSDKIFMGMPNYGYDWTLPFVKGKSAAESLSNVQAVNTAIANSAEIMFDEIAASPYFNYFARENGKTVEHVVWFQNARSVDEMSRLAAEKNLRGIAIWNVMRYFPQMWSTLNSLFNIVKK